MKSLCDFIVEKLNYANNGDEFYTKLKDIQNCMKYFDFNGKIVYCNCDDPKKSNFYKFFHDNFSTLKLKKLLATYYSNEPYLYEYDQNGEKTTQIESGKFQDNENILKQCDIIVTNPPYSQNMTYKLIKMCFDNNKDFIFVGPLHMINKKDIFTYIKNEQIFSLPISINTFDRPNNIDKNSPSCWWTNIYIDKNKFNNKFKPHKIYNENDYPKYDNYDAINCNKWEYIPKNYKNKIGVPYRFITQLDKNEYKIIDILSNLKINNKSIACRLIIQQK